MQNKPVHMKIGGNVVRFVTMAGLAELCDRKPFTLKMWEKDNWLPKANFSKPPVKLADGSVRPGARLYTYEYALKMAALIKQVRQGKQIPNEIIQGLFLLSREEKQKFSPSKS